MTASRYIKNNGLKSLKQVCSITGRNRATLINWFNNDKELFDTVVLGCVFKVNFGGQYKVAVDIFNGR